MTALLDVQDLHTEFSTLDGVVRAVTGVDFSIERGSTLGLVGESGCGKSVTALSIMRLVDAPGRITEGRVRLDGSDLLELSDVEMREVRGRRIGMIFQEPMTSLNPVYTVGEQIAETIVRHRHVSHAEAWRQAVTMLERVRIPDAGSRARDYPHQLSGGMRQRVMIAIALCCDPELLIADEPTTALDVTIQAQILDLLGDLQRETGMSVLLITHDLGVVAAMCQETAVMYAGEIVERGLTDDVVRRAGHPYTQGLLRSMPQLGTSRHQRLTVIPGVVPSALAWPDGCRFAARCHARFERCAEHPPEITVGDGHGHGAACWLVEEAGEGVATLAAPPAETLPEPAVEAAEEAAAEADAAATAGEEPVLLRAEGLRTYFPVRRGLLRRTVGHVRAVDGVDLELRRGETLGLVGESGCGKSTLGRTLLRLIPATGGRIEFDGRDLLGASGAELKRLRSDMQIVFQDPVSSLNPRMSVGDIIGEGLLVQGMRSRAAREHAVRDVLERVGLRAEHLNRYPHEFSGGQRQRIGIARALVLQPRLLVADEPVSALDVSVQSQVLNLLADLKRDFGLTYLFIAHDLAVVAYLSDRVAVMYLGQIAELGPSTELYDRPLHPYTQSLISAIPELEPSRRRERIELDGDVPSPLSPPSGCRFRTRCPLAKARGTVDGVCAESTPPLTRKEGGRWAACHLV